MIADDARMPTRILIAALLLLAGACKKSEDARPATSAAEPAGGAAAAPAGSAAAAAAAPATSLDETSYETRAVVFMGDFTKVFASAGTDCEKLATGIDKFIDDNKTLIVDMRAYETAHPEAKTALDDAMQVEYKKQQEVMLPVLQACADKAPVQDALARFDEFD